MKNYMILLLAAIAGLFTSCETITEVEVDPGLANYIIDYQMLGWESGDIKIFDYKNDASDAIVFGILVQHKKMPTLFTGNFRCPRTCLIEADMMRQVTDPDEILRIVENINVYAETCSDNCVTISHEVLQAITTDSTKYLGVSTMPGGFVNVTSVHDLRQIDAGRSKEKIAGIDPTLAPIH